MNIYKVQMYVKCTEEDAISLRKILAQTIYDEFELGSVFGVSVVPDVPPENLMDRVMALYVVEPQSGMDEKQIGNFTSALPLGRKYMPIEFHNDSASAYGLVDSEYYEKYNFNAEFFAEATKTVLGDKLHKPSRGIYILTEKDGNAVLSLEQQE